MSRCASSSRPRPAFASPTCAPNSTCTRARPSTSESWVDPLIGSRIGLDLTDRWGITSEANIGGFGVGSDFTRNAQAYVGYETSLFGRLTTFLFGYRALYQDYHHRDFEWDVPMHGPVIGTAVRF
jgi:hypothetical protein